MDFNGAAVVCGALPTRDVRRLAADAGTRTDPFRPRRRKTSRVSARQVTQRGDTAVGPPSSGRLADGTPYYGRIGEMAYDDDRVQCHLCGRWFKWVGGSHLWQGHEWSLDEYRETFQLLRTMTTASPATSLA